MSLPSTDLRTWWASASPRERDAKVAEALGFEPRDACRYCGHRQADHRGGGLCELCIEPWDTTSAHSGCQAYKPPFVPPYSTSWEHAGGLLDRLRAEGWDYRLSASTVGVPPWITIARLTTNGPLRIDARGDDERETVALAFCLAKEAQP